MFSGDDKTGVKTIYLICSIQNKTQIEVSLCLIQRMA